MDAPPASVAFREVWAELAALGRVLPPKPYARDGRWGFYLEGGQSKEAALKACPRAKAFDPKAGAMWFETQQSANAKGWDWSGETEVSVFQFCASSLKEDWYKSWPDFWEKTVGRGNNLPRLKGKPDAVVLVHSGGTCLTLAQKGTTFYIVFCIST
ncbi:uncharacterized protein ACA1_135950 [Acanthamoeba castellanii str. Neff]|uniref:Uncharacterized protein n=1 Tax=Acanthamoeba castellanii (strain ATCC 30010 / Neff) TaxID=1257118 RepID=L8GE70_ACACF|nr:uncharacterized protein ACA1_135950 [Acanthamoeba castellanii str. Neff]ELR11395.1 hypothetical protein ACA1_135950 [Acanthamoeba castellanii str. Neff]